MHPIVRTHMHNALQSLGITDHPHAANALPLRYPRWGWVDGDEDLSVSVQQVGPRNVTAAYQRVAEVCGNIILASTVHAI